MKVHSNRNSLYTIIYLFETWKHYVHYAQHVTNITVKHMGITRKLCYRNAPYIWVP